MLQLMHSFPKQERSFKKNFIPKALIHIQTKSKLHISYLHIDVEFNHDLLSQFKKIHIVFTTYSSLSLKSEIFKNVGIKFFITCNSFISYIFNG